ncbi:MAG: hypothetical protein ACK48W_10730 [Bacteroidota bacterium]|jgi:hypothetical protein
MRKLVLLFFILLYFIFSKNLFAQNRPGQQVVAVGAGSSVLGIALRVANTALTVNGEQLSITPMLSVGYDNALDSVFSLGFIYSGQSFTLSRKNGNYTDKFSIIHNNFAFRSLLHLTKKSQKNDFYVGARIGYSLFNFRSTLPVNNIPNEAFSLYSGYSFQALMGYRGYLTEDIGIGFEFAFGRPYWSSIFLCYRFGQTKPTKIIPKSSNYTQPGIQYK